MICYVRIMRISESEGKHLLSPSHIQLFLHYSRYVQRRLIIFPSFLPFRLEEFMSGFKAISVKLKEMYQMITLGGDAELELVDSYDPFTEGILFSVRPPKKNWKVSFGFIATLPDID